MTFFQILQIVGPFLSITAIIVFTLAYFWVQSKNGTIAADEKKDRVASQVIATYETRIKQLEDDRILLNERINTMSQEIGKMQGEIAAKNKQIEILQGRNPEVDEILKKLSDALTPTNPQTVAAQEYMKEGKAFMKAGYDYINASLPIIKELKDHIERTQKLIK